MNCRCAWNLLLARHIDQHVARLVRAATLHWRSLKKERKDVLCTVARGRRDVIDRHDREAISQMGCSVRTACGVPNRSKRHEYDTVEAINRLPPSECYEALTVTPARRQALLSFLGDEGEARVKALMGTPRTRAWWR